ncbi:MAG TPA: aldo/keto reductase [Lacunisphaera sp.]|jgi:aryl-alcohol dehydrogenase-like predicted oxidoreductase|nr:aldo/keto reductase [Lacunisphaera sp.]
MNAQAEPGSPMSQRTATEKISPAHAGPAGGLARAPAMGRRDELRLPSLGLGCWAFGGGSYWGAQEQGDVDRVVARALEVGLNYFDTAESYNAGASEESLGRALRGRRSSALIGTKVSPHNAYPHLLAHHCEQSLRRLGTDHIDLYMIHWPLNAHSLSHFTSDETVIQHPPGLAAVLEAMAGLRAEGKIRFIGVSNFGPVQLAEAMSLGVPIAANELPYNLLMRAAEAEALPYCVRHGIRTLGYSALMQGLLARPMHSFAGQAPMRLRTRHFSRARTDSRHGEEGCEEETLAALQQIARIATEAGRGIGEMALAWVLANPRIDCALVGCRDLGQLEENLRAGAHPLPLEVKQALDRATLPVKRRLGPRLDYFQSAQQTRSW